MNIFNEQWSDFAFHLGVTVYTPTYILNQSEVVIMFSSGAGVEVIENAGHMTARVYMPWAFIVSSLKNKYPARSDIIASLYIYRIKREVFLVIGVLIWLTISLCPVGRLWQ